MLYSRLSLIKALLSENGVLFLHCDWRTSGDTRLVLDEIFGSENLVNELIWNKGFRGTEAKRIFQRSHDSIFFYSKGKNYIWNQQGQPYKDPNLARYNQVDEEGNRYALIKRRRTNGEVYYGKTYPKAEGKSVNDVISHVPTMASTDSERIGYPTQKPEALIELLIKSTTNEGCLVADFFCGSGTTLAVAEKLGRRWIGSDLGRFAIHTTRKRILEIKDAKPFEILNLGKYERQHWSTAHFGEDSNEDGKIDYYEYIKFILKLYKAEAISGGNHLHGRRSKAMIRVGSVSSPVTFQEVQEAIDECLNMGAKELHVLGWEWEMNLHSMINQVKNQHGIKLVLNQIPREAMEEEAVKKDHIEFYELAYVDCEIAPTKKALTVQCSLDDFVISNPELVPDKVREKIKKWSDYINYWAIDWDFKNDTFMSTWMTYRTNKDSTLSLKSDAHTYEKPGNYKVMIKVIDVFGNDTSVIREVTVK